MIKGGLEENAIKDSSTWDHMKKLLQHMIKERPSQPTSSIESLSSLICNGQIVPQKVTTVYHDQLPKPTHAVPAAKQRSDAGWAVKMNNQIVPPKPVRKPLEEDEEPPEEEPEEDKGELADVISEQEVFNKFGEGIPTDEAYRVAISLKRLIDKEPLAKARFWGKILGIKRNYYIAETKIDEDRVQPTEEPEFEEEEEPEGKPIESILQGLTDHQIRPPPKVLPEEGKGVNEYTYYVATSDDLSTWVKLPDVLPSHIAAARSINKYFTGDLESVVDCHPAFPGTERHYLRAQIARIYCACTICPKGIYTTEGAEEEEEEDENGNKKPKRFKVKPYEEIPPLNPQEVPDPDDAEAVAQIRAFSYGYKYEELLEIDNWVHIAPTLLKEGRATKFVPEDEPNDESPDADEEDDTALAEGRFYPSQAQELINPFLSDLSHDSPMSLDCHSRKNLKSWALRKAFSSSTDSTRAYLARSLRWPGALCYAIACNNKPGAQHQNYYFGNGVKANDIVMYAPPLPPRTCLQYPLKGVKLMKDATFDDEIEFDPTPPVPKVKRDEEEEEEQE